MFLQTCRSCLHCMVPIQASQRSPNANKGALMTTGQRPILVDEVVCDAHALSRFQIIE
jgi:hypothetical protein